MKRLVFLGKCICFFLIFCLILLIVQENLRDKWAEGEYNVSVKVKGFYAEEKNSLDVVFIGSSQMYADMAPAVIFDQYGITSYDFCANEQPLWVSYYYIKEALKHQNPKVIVLDVFTVYGDALEDEGVMHINLDDIPLGINKIMAIRDGVEKDLRYSYYFPIAKYHNTWTDLYQQKAEFSFYKEKDPNKGYSPFIFPGEYLDAAKTEVVNQTQTEPIPRMARQWLYKIIDLCKKEGVELLLTKTPNGNSERQKLYNCVAEIAEETNTPFFNMNTLLDGQAHINILQAEKVSSMMGEYLNTHYTFTDKRSDPAYADWKETVLLFQRQKGKCEIISADDFNTYLPLLNREGYVVFITYKNQQKTTLEDRDLLYFNEILGLHCDLSQNQEYFAVLEDGNIILESSVAGEGIASDEKGLSGSLSLEYDNGKSLNATLISSGDRTDGSSSLIINGTDFSMNCDGFNFAIYDKYLGEMVEMSAFDQTDNMNLLRK